MCTQVGEKSYSSSAEENTPIKLSIQEQSRARGRIQKQSEPEGCNVCDLADASSSLFYSVDVKVKAQATAVTQPV